MGVSRAILWVSAGLFYGSQAILWVSGLYPGLYPGLHTPGWYPRVGTLLLYPRVGTPPAVHLPVHTLYADPVYTVRRQTVQLFTVGQQGLGLISQF